DLPPIPNVRLLQSPYCQSCLYELYLTSSAGLECLQQYICDALGSQNISPNNSSTIGGTQERPFRNYNGNRFQASLIQRDIILDKTAKDVNDCAECNRLRGIDIAIYLRACPAKVERRFPFLGVNVDFETNRRTVVHIIHCR